MSFPFASPWPALAAWMADAVAAEPRVPDAMQLATVDADGRPSIRTVLLKEFGPQGLVFYTNLGSQKAVEIEANPSVAVCLHWKEIGRQVVAQGRAALVDGREADAYWRSRPRPSQIGGWASRQSQEVSGREELVARVEQAAARFADAADVPRPPFWSGFRIQPVRVEFWKNADDRLHDRWAFERGDDGTWKRCTLFP